MVHYFAHLGTRRRCWPRHRPPANRSQSCSSFCVFTCEGEECSRSLFQSHLPEVHLVLYCHTLAVTRLPTTNKLTAIDFSLFKTKKLVFLFFPRVFLFQKSKFFSPSFPVKFWQQLENSAQSRVRRRFCVTCRTTAESCWLMCSTLTCLVLSTETECDGGSPLYMLANGVVVSQ